MSLACIGDLLDEMSSSGHLTYAKVYVVINVKNVYF